MFGVTAMLIMQRKGRSEFGGFALGFLLGPFGLLVVLAISPNRGELEKRVLERIGLRKCPQCPEFISRKARDCRYCGSEVAPIGGS